MSDYYSVHTHSRYSSNDALPRIDDMVARAVDLGYPALGLTDHGTPAGVVQLYKSCRKAGIEPLPGIELYMTPDHGMREQRSHHLTVVAYTETGYRNLVRLTTLANRSFYYRPRVDLADLAELAENGYTQGLAVGTGCRSGLVTRTWQTQGEKAARRLTETLAGWFPRLYVEIMNHGFEADGVLDDEIVDGLIAIADSAGLPVIVTGDAHYLHPGDKDLHDWLKTLVSFSDDPSEGKFSGEGYHLADVDWLRGFIEPDVLDRGLEGLTDLLGAAKVRIPELDEFVLKVPNVMLKPGLTVDQEIENRVFAALEARGWVADPDRLVRATTECDVIADTGMAAYLLVVAGLCDFMRAKDIWFHARGSVTGSFACYLLGITQDDPVDWAIRMDRFLSGDRTSPPDIDLDIDHSRRDEVVAELKRLYATRQVCSYGTYRIDDDDEAQKGSLRVRYFAVQRKFRNVANNERVPADDWAKLKALASLELVRQTGTHPAGFLIANTDAELDTLPMARIDSTGNLVTAYDKDDVEPFGYPKIDLLGLRTLEAVRIASELINPADPKGFYDTIALDDNKALKLLGTGDTVGMFQLEGWSQRKGCQALRPDKVGDVVAAQALFRPGVSEEFVDVYMRRRRGELEIPAMHPTITAELADTYGVAIFQEQVVGVLRSIGMPPVELTGMLKAVKASGRAGIEKAKAAVKQAMPRVLELAGTAGWGEADLAWIERALTDYGAGYAFGKAHSVRYGVVAYKTAWLRAHEPLAFWTGMLTAYTGHKDAKKRDVELIYRGAARSDGLTILDAHVNHSDVAYKVEDGKIRIGLISLKWVGKTAAVELVSHAPYTTLRHLGEQCASNKVSGGRGLAVGDHPRDLGETTAVHALWKAGALKGLPHEKPPEQPTDEQLAMVAGS